jgi:hypothetical protein
VALSKSEKTVVLLLLDAASRTYSDTERVQLRADVLGALGMTEADAGEHQAAARDQAEQNAADAPAEAEAAAADAPATDG